MENEHEFFRKNLKTDKSLNFYGIIVQVKTSSLLRFSSLVRWLPAILDLQPVSRGAVFVRPSSHIAWYLMIKKKLLKIARK